MSGGGHAEVLGRTTLDSRLRGNDDMHHRRPRESGGPDWIPAYAGMTTCTIVALAKAGAQTGFPLTRE